MYKKYGKRILDILVSSVAIVVLFPLFFLTACLIGIKLGFPVFFRQKRPGLHEKLFTMYKFRTMSNKTDKNGKLLSDSERLSGFGKGLRATSLDELPELFNVIKGDMSLVGPRPLLEEYLPRYNEEQRKRHDVRPGLTGLAQVNGRNGISWESRFQYDLDYIKHITFLGDMKILLITIKKVFLRDGITSETSVTMDVFKGEKKHKI